MPLELLGSVCAASSMVHHGQWGTGGYKLAAARSKLACALAGGATSRGARLGGMVRPQTNGLGAIFAAADANGGDIASAWRDNGQVTSLKNATRRYKQHCARRPKRAAAKPAAKRTAKPAVARKPSVKKNLRLPSRFVEEAAADKVRHRQEVSAAHKAATAEINRLSQNVLAISFFSTVKSQT